MTTMIDSSPTAAIGNQGRWKRRASDDEDKREGEVKKSRYSWYFTLESESSEPTSEDDESIYSIQAYETEFARDTSDTSTHSWLSNNESDVSVHVEYELNSHSENEVRYSDMSTCSEPENIVAVEFIAFRDTEGLADDSDDSRSSIDSEIKRADFWTCVQCKNPNNNPMFRYCEKCYQVRKTHFPRSRPRRRARVQKKSQNNKMTTASSVASASSGHELCEMDSGIASSHCEIDSGIGSSQDLDKPITSSQASDAPTLDSQASDAPTLDSQASEEPIFGSQSIVTPSFNSQSSELSSAVSSDSQCSEIATLTTTRTTTKTRIVFTSRSIDDVDSGSTPKEYDSDSYSSDSADNRQTKDTADESQSGNPDSPSPMTILTQKLQTRKEASNPDAESADARCLICTVAPKNSAFVHGKTMHICCCYRCSVKVWMTNGQRCPICNRKVHSLHKCKLQ
ncbi:E3 ubiquitin-protein ligase Mdm2 isoform X2 [Nasonia vitripennis]|uniref:Uncharacterized protein n=1 Tax=Nasonia vitripennis TaxID=7425 RepID=A0A7M7TAZ1_NASVI|nr:E3 ubiquitin-protein ligase Mdm2 isoform X2 [Nasonia vitripennis]